jgi:GT2 family glycosyltransferase
VSPKIYFYPEREFHQDAYTKEERGKVVWYAGGLIDWENVYAYHRGVNEVDHGHFNTPEETMFATGCCIGVRAEVIREVGKLNQDYFFGLEDLEWSMRVKAAGYTIWYQPDAVIWHKNAGSSGGSGSEIHQYYQTRNRLLFGMRYASVKTRIHLIKQAVNQMVSGNTHEKMGTKDYFLHRLGGRT